MSSLDNSTDAIVVEAATWIARIDGGEMTDADRTELREWANRSPRHMAELRRLGEMWCDIDDLLFGEDTAEVPPASILSVVSAGAKTRPGWVYGLAAAIMFAVSMTFFVSPISTEQSGPVVFAHNTQAGETRLVELPDGSQLHMNVATSLEYIDSPGERSINLISGEVLVDVEKDKQRPFYIRTDGVTAKAIGTMFSVRVFDNAATVIVSEGVVEVSQTEATKAAAVLKAGDVANVVRSSGKAEVEVVSFAPKDVSNKHAWKDGILIFDGEPLSEVVGEISRYTSFSVVISDPELRDLPIGGVFPIGETASLLGALETSFDIDVEFVDADTVYLSRAR